MPTRYYRPNFFHNLFGGTHNTNLPTLLPVTFQNYQFAAPCEGTFSSTCPDIRSLAGNVNCRPGSVPPGLIWPIKNTLDWHLSEDGSTPDLTPWEEWSANYLSGTLWKQYPVGTVVNGPRLTDLDPPPDYVTLTIGIFRTNWWGYNVGCCGSLSGCGRYVWEQPTFGFDAPGEPRVDSRVPFFPTFDSQGGFPTYITVTGTTAGEDPDPTGPGLTGAVLEPSRYELSCPLSSTYRRTEFGPAVGGLLRPPVTSYLPNANSTSWAVATDAMNTACKELWRWEDVRELETLFTFGVADEKWWKIAWGEVTTHSGVMFLRVNPFWLLEPPEEPLLGRIDAGPMTNHIRRIRGQRTGHDAQPN